MAAALPALLLGGCAGTPPRPASGPTSPTASAWALPTPSPSPSPPADDWPTYHRDAARTGVDPGPPFSSVAPAWSATVDGDVYAEPLVVGGRLFVATENDSVYAFDLAAGGLLWQRRLGSPVPLSNLPCGDVNPVGITGTPVADPARGLLYVAGLLAPAHHQLFALSLADGRVEWQRAIDVPGADPKTQNQRAALALGAGTVYVAYGGRYGDCGEYHGAVVGAPAGGDGPLLTFRVPSQNAAGIWAPPGPSIGADGSLYVTTGNSFTSGAFDYGDSVIRLSAGLALGGWFATPDWLYRDRNDLDLGSIGPTLVDGGLVFQTGKEGTGYLLRADRLGGIGGEVFAAAVCGTAFGGTAYSAPYVYVPCASGGLTAIRIAGSSFSIAWRSPTFYAEPPIVAGGLIWSVDRNTATLIGLASAGGAVRFRFPLGRVDHFATPTTSDGYLVVGAGSRVIAFRGAP